MHNDPSITPELLIEGLLEEEVVTDQVLISLLGQSRHDISLTKLEKALLQNNVLSETRLLLLKGIKAGLPVLDNPNIGINTSLNSSTVRSAGALLLDLPDLTVAFVEDSPLNVEKVANALQTTNFSICLMTSLQFVELYKSAYMGEKRDDRLVAGSIFEILDEAVSRRASDIHLSIGQPPVLRVDGALYRMNTQSLDAEWMDRELAILTPPELLLEARENFAADFAYQFGDSRFRCNIGANSHGLNLAARTLPSKVPNLEDLNLPFAIRRFAALERGLVLVTGPTGSGKSTTLAALLGDICLNQSRHVITLEDPIEYTLPNTGKSQVDQRELGQSFLNFPDGLRQALRQDPDVILVGELRDLETMRTAIMAAETGHLVFGTLHTYDASSTVGRLVSAFNPEEQAQVKAQLAYILKGIVSQTLLPNVSGKGRVAAYEVLVATSAVSNNLRSMDGQNQLRQAIETGRKDGMQTMEAALADLVRSGKVSEHDAEFKARDLDDFHRRLQANGAFNTAKA